MSSITATGINGTNYTVSVTPSGTADVTVQVPAGAATDGVNGSLASETDTIDYVDSTAPTVVSVERHGGTAAQDEATNADTLTFRVTFSEDVENVDAADFDPTGTTATATNVSGSGAVYVVTVSDGDLADYNGAVGLGFATDQNIADGSGQRARLPTTAERGTDYETYTVDNTGPAVVSLARADGLHGTTTLRRAFDRRRHADVHRGQRPQRVSGERGHDGLRSPRARPATVSATAPWSTVTATSGPR